MSELVLTDLSPSLIIQLQERAADHGRSPVEEAKEILSSVLQSKTKSEWATVDAIFGELQRSGRSFSNSADQIGEDRAG